MDPEIQQWKRRVALEPYLLALHRTTEADSFWAALQSLLDAAFSNQSIVAALRVGGESPPFFYHTHRRAHHNHAWFSRTLMAHPCYAHLMARPGTPVLRLGEVLPAESLQQHPFYREFMEPEGWFHGMAFVFWTKNHIEALIPVNRSCGQADFSEDELRLALWLHPQIEVALRRITEVLSITEAHKSLVAYLTDLPLPTLRLCWNLRLVHANKAARELLDEWRSLRETPARGANGRSRVRVPREIRDTCLSLKQGILESGHQSWPPPSLPPAVHLPHPMAPGFTAVVRPTISSRRALSNPCFWVHLERETEPAGKSLDFSANGLLSPAERAVAGLLVQGLTNDEIADRLHRSLSTVKAQLQSSYRKLGVHNRTGMIAKLHGRA